MQYYLWLYFPDHDRVALHLHLVEFYYPGCMLGY